MDIEEYDIRRSFQNSFYRGLPISTFSDDLNILELPQPENDATARQRFVVYD
jgi:hypothetical protein